MAVNSSSPFVIEIDPVGHTNPPGKGVGQLTQITTNTRQYFCNGRYIYPSESGYLE
jgi:hypothetical protein